MENNQQFVRKLNSKIKNLVNIYKVKNKFLNP